MRARNLVIALLSQMTACVYQPPSVRLQGSPVTIATLAGQWVGDYGSERTGRNGSILFRLTAGGDSAYGDVLMVDARPARLNITDASAAHVEHTHPTQLLRIAFVRVANGRVSGAMVPYTDPDCECQVMTTFVGVVAGDVIEGTYVTRAVNRQEQSGTWRARRKTR